MQESDEKKEKIVLALTESQDILYNYLFLRLGGDDTAREVLQETNLAIWKNIGHLDAPENFLPWAKALANLEIRHYFTKRKRDDAKIVFDSEAVAALAEKLAAPAEECYEEVDYQMLKQCIGQLPRDKQRMVNRRYWDDRSVDDIAREEKLPYSTVAVQLLRIRKALGDCIRRLRCCFENNAEPSPDESTRAELLERVLGGDASRGRELGRRLAEDDILRGEWIATASIHAAILFNRRKLRTSLPNGCVMQAENRPATPVPFFRRPFVKAAVIAATFAALLCGEIALRRMATEGGNSLPKSRFPSVSREALPAKSAPQPARVPQETAQRQTAAIASPALSQPSMESSVQADTKKENATMKKEIIGNAAQATVAAVLTLTAAMPIAASGSAPDTSADIVVVSQPKKSRYWHSVPGPQMPLSLQWPQNATSAILTVADILGKTNTFALAKADYPRFVALPRLSAPDAEGMSKDVYKLTLLYSDGTKHTATLGNVGGVSGSPVRVLTPTNAPKLWNRVERSTVLPVSYGETTLAIDHSVRNLDGEEGWYGWFPVTKGEHSLVQGDRSVTVRKRETGFVIMLR